MINAGKDSWNEMKTRFGWNVRGCAGHLRETKPPSTHPRPKSVQAGSEREQDFTTKGVNGNLECPFAKMNDAGPSSHSSVRTPAATFHGTGRLPTPPHGIAGHAIDDPIKAEFHADAFSSPPPSVTGSASKCPIRFLDQHSPEEVAKYFENHKHEIPRSHAICVKRYQSNAESIRQLDAKYGNLVSMIQGLGMKHQSLLPTENERDMMDGEGLSTDRVGRWAEAISERRESPEDMLDQEEPDERTGHFDRPLKEIRVGESPSRPWGISVPTAGDPVILADLPHEVDDVVERHADESNRELPPEPTPAAQKGQCPFHFDRPISTPRSRARSRASVADPPAASASTKREQPGGKSKQHKRQQPPSQIAFTGPVFIGYSAEQAITVLQQCGIGSKSTTF